MEKTTFHLGLISAAALLSACSGGGSKNQSENKQKNPNVVFLIADDLGIGDLSCYGATKIQTPNIDRLASQGLQFANAYTTSSTSTPTRFVLTLLLLQVHLHVSVFLQVCILGVRKIQVSHRVILS